MFSVQGQMPYPTIHLPWLNQDDFPGNQHSPEISYNYPPFVGSPDDYSSPGSSPQDLQTYYQGENLLGVDPAPADIPSPDNTTTVPDCYQSFYQSQRYPAESVQPPTLYQQHLSPISSESTLNPSRALSTECTRYQRVSVDSTSQDCGGVTVQADSSGVHPDLYPHYPDYVTSSHTTPYLDQSSVATTYLDQTRLATTYPPTPATTYPHAPIISTSYTNQASPGVPTSCTNNSLYPGFQPYPPSMPPTSLAAAAQGNIPEIHSGMFVYPPFEYPSTTGKVKKEKKRADFSAAHLRILEAAFVESDFARGARREELSQKCGVPIRTITVWFQNKRAKLRKEKKGRELLEIAAKTGVVN